VTQDIILTCAINGGGERSHLDNPRLPITPEQIFAEIREVAAAGASVAHIHARDPETGRPSNEPALFSEIAARVREAGVDILLNLSCSMEGTLIFDDAHFPALDAASTLVPVKRRVGHALENRPEIATIDCGTFAVGEAVFVARRSDLREMARLYRDASIKPEIECFDLGHMETARALVAEGSFAPPPFVQICLGTAYGGAPATPEAFEAMRSRVPNGAQWAGFASGPDWAFTAEAAARAGGHMRTGLEDTLLLTDGRPASNIRLVKQAIAIAERVGRRIASPARAKSILGLA
jgi:3-dehydrocarnitine:acetyl-CoA trimethylamine transferase